MTITAQSGLREPIVAGIVTALVGFTSSFAVVIAGLRAVGATPEQAASGLFALTVVFGIGIIVLSVRSRAPITLAWSTPGAALLVSMGAGHDAGWAAAVGAFLVVGGLILLVGLIPVLGDLISRIPTPIAQAMLGGVLLSLCLAPMESLAAEPLLTLPVLIAWLVATRVVARWALPLTLLTALVVIAVYVWGHGTEQPVESTWLPSLSWTTPQLDVAAIAGIAIPLFVVTMASQNIPGVAVLSSFGYATPWRAAMTVTGAGTAVIAPFGGHAMNLAALSAALAAGEEAGPDRSRRWIAGVSAGVGYLVLAVLSGALVTVATIAPGGLVEAVAGLALLGTFAAALVGAFTAVETRIPAALTFVAAASGLTFLGIGGAFWGLVIGLVTHAALRATTSAPSTGR
ncbi:benzoate/H(+) symporter BenE family transporter [Gordonia sp. HNM0687]|uniref:Benzoate/H(+) symporter BenE family transporter n=1 Tax=Gordonia mangrovi TaxID=2665643 RepID=A0A6L7GVK5_9ACTN|nr:benzoate/H(+) symporter BenE family transporter [Gordonia mangrovi]MXP23930.1 benzoate/H(+) symporter BenE family transporter [Gordonia mangrovi]UVF76480.1 benzoate/H(+) symporter BenE family transporter [Gordonia mangrovi]